MSHVTSIELVYGFACEGLASLDSSMLHQKCLLDGRKASETDV